MLCAKSGKYWSNGSGKDVENVAVDRETGKRTDGKRTTGDEESSLKFPNQVS
jgi:hypothetical protein